MFLMFLFNVNKIFWLMVNLELSYAHYSVLLQSLLCRMDCLSDQIKKYSANNNSEMVCILKDDLSDAYELYIKLKNS